MEWHFEYQFGASNMSSLGQGAIWGAPGAPKYTLNASRTSSAAALKNELA